MKKIILVACLTGLSMAAVADMPAPIGPNPQLTPGATRPVTLAQLCKPGAAKAARNVPESEKLAVYREYGMHAAHTGYCAGPNGCEIDHLISLELGGSNDIKNLWPQPYDGAINAHMKDKVENATHAAICSGKMTLQDAQHAIATDWHMLYLQFQLQGVIK
jgi:hypothetical protein